MKTQDLAQLGVPLGEAQRRGVDFIAAFLLKGGDKNQLEAEIRTIVATPQAYRQDPLRAPLAEAILRTPPPLRTTPAPFRRWGADLDPEAVCQMDRACQLPVAVAGALMPDAHVGYGLPIGGVLATQDAIVPYAVGVDIACRMKLTVLDLPVRDLDRKRERLIAAIEGETRFGVGAQFQNPRREHPVMDLDWSVSPVTARNRDRAWAQLGTSGSGNHFVEFGTFVSDAPVHDGRRELPAGEYVALLSHSGSRGTGAAVCDHYSRLAIERLPGLARELKQLAWLDLAAMEGREYWEAMQLMGKYAAANHALIHQQLAARLGLEVLLDVENHHNFAWRETHEIEGRLREVIVHRKGATPAGAGVLGIIPGSMASPGFLVRGKGERESLHSAAHGAGRIMSRKTAHESLSWDRAKRVLKDARVHLISAGLDEVPMAYKNILDVMAAQADLVEILGRFDPRLVKMAPSGERLED